MARLKRLDDRAFPPPPQIPDEQWCSRDYARLRLRISDGRVSLLIHGEILQRAVTGDGRSGVTLASVEAEEEWRSRAGPIRRGLRGWGWVGFCALLSATP